MKLSIRELLFSEKPACPLTHSTAFQAGHLLGARFSNLVLEGRCPEWEKRGKRKGLRVPHKVLGRCLGGRDTGDCGDEVPRSVNRFELPPISALPFPDP